MLTKSKVAFALIDGISSVREDEELQDFVVEAEGKEFKCHRLILSACSGFFSGLFRSGMKESQQQRTTLEGISMETFAAILEMLYTGSENLTRDNMLNVWLAGDQLQMAVVCEICVEFISNNISNETVLPVWEIASRLLDRNVQEICESFIRNNTSLENWENIYTTANSLGSHLILSHVRDFVKKNYERVIKSKSFLCLHENDLLEIIRSQNLVVSCEDVVVESIFIYIKSDGTNNCATEDASPCRQKESCISCPDEQTSKITEIIQTGQGHLSSDENSIDQTVTEYSGEDRKKCLERLLSQTRLCLVNSVTLEKLARDTFVMGNEKTKEMVMEAFMYKSNGRQHGVLLTAALHRNCSELVNVGVIAHVNRKFSACTYDPLNLKSFKLPFCLFLDVFSHVHLISYMTDIFAVGDLDSDSSVLCLFTQKDWRQVTELSGHGWLGAAVDEFIYLVNSSSRRVKRFDPRLGNCVLERCPKFPTEDAVEHVCSFDFFVLAFCSVIINGVDKMVVHCLDTRSQTWTRLGGVERSAENVVSFRREKQLYVLQTCGNLWEVTRDDSNRLKLELSSVLWHDYHRLCGAICNNNNLYIVVAGSSKRYYKTKYSKSSRYSESESDEEEEGFEVSSNLFSNIYVIVESLNSSNVVPAVLKKSSLRLVEQRNGCT